MTKIVWLGTGSGFNTVLGNTSFVVSGDTDRKLLVDCGFLVTPCLQAHGLINQITDIVITHHHADHIGGLELLAFYWFFVLADKQKPVIHLPNQGFADRLWNEALRAGLGYNQYPDGSPRLLSLSDYFIVEIGTKVLIPGLPIVEYIPTNHLTAMESYALRFGDQMYYSGDSTELPSTGFPIIFQDCQFTQGLKFTSHIEYERLKVELFPETRQKTWLVHLGNGWEKIDASADGFAGFVRPGQEFVL